MCFTSTTANNSGQDGCGDCACVKERCGRQACIATHLIPPSSSHALACCCTALARQDMGFDPEMSELYADSSECCRNHSRTSCSVCICFACLCVYVCVCVCVCVWCSAFACCCCQSCALCAGYSVVSTLLPLTLTLVLARLQMWCTCRRSETRCTTVTKISAETTVCFVLCFHTND